MVSFKKHWLREWIEGIAVAGMVALMAHTFLAKPFAIPSESMCDTLQKGDMIFVNRFIYWDKIPDRGDIVVFKFPGSSSLVPYESVSNNISLTQWQRGPYTDYIKRCIGLPCDVIDFRDGQVYVNNVPLQEPYLREAMNPIPFIEQLPYKVPEGYIFVMGDNRNNSWDSRFWGPVNVKFLKGKAFLMHWYSRDREGYRVPFEIWKPWTLWRVRLIK